jgi:hypothetical protein
MNTMTTRSRPGRANPLEVEGSAGAGDDELEATIIGTVRGEREGRGPCFEPVGPQTGVGIPSAVRKWRLKTVIEAGHRV